MQGPLVSVPSIVLHSRLCVGAPHVEAHSSPVPASNLLLASRVSTLEIEGATSFLPGDLHFSREALRTAERGAAAESAAAVSSDVGEK